VSRRLELRPNDRVLVVAPHPDDETLAAGGLLQQARAARAAVRVLFATDGENDPWPQRIAERRLRLDAEAPRRWARRRREEALSALDCLGISGESAVFLGLPDRGLTSLVTTNAAATAGALAAEIDRFAPTLLVTSSPADLHPDHSALAVLVTLAAARVSRRTPMLHVEYLVNRPAESAAGADRFWIRPSPEQQLCKHRSLLRYRSQLLFRRRFFLSFVEEVEEFLHPAPALAADAHAIEATGDGEELRVRIRAQAGLAALGPRTLLAAGFEGAAQTAGLAIALRSGTTAVRDAATGRAVGEATFRRSGALGELTMPRALLAGATTAFLKVEHRIGFFDAGGWTRAIDLPPAADVSMAERRVPRVGAAAR
jgi:LmbE family N-acetylglucosaminyl deacetylase